VNPQIQPSPMFHSPSQPILESHTWNNPGNIQTGTFGAPGPQQNPIFKQIFEQSDKMVE